VAQHQGATSSVMANSRDAVLALQQTAGDRLAGRDLM